MSIFPPLWRYWPIYIILTLITGIFGYVWLFVLQSADFDAYTIGTEIFAIAVVITLALVANAWSRWTTTRLMNALERLQALRLDRDYIERSSIVHDAIRADPTAEWEKPLPPSLAAKFNERDSAIHSKEPTFREASLFLLNQYEFLASAARSGAIDIVLIDDALRAPIRGLVETYSTQICLMRRSDPNHYQNLIWVYERLNRKKFWCDRDRRL